ncbi:MAG: hypothetical protein M1818_002738 [Claussenomyces sp. TS43310]|nr:MAG: hypothetical protein M1818_002738 [Claussenomyces sp. TS43310]
MLPNWSYTQRFAPFAKYGETFLTVAPDKITIYTASPEIICQITQRREAFPKSLESYAVLNIYGRNILSTEGAEWKQHRKVTSPSFTEKNNALVFKESVAQTQSMLQKWTAPHGMGHQTQKDVASDTMLLTLHIISMVGFGVQLWWEGEEPSKKGKRSGVNYGSHEAPNGHTMSYSHALELLLENLILVLLMPKWLLRTLPFKRTHLAHDAFVNWGQYMNELFKTKIAEAEAGEQSEGMDIMGALVKSAYGDKKSPENNKQKGQGAKLVLTDSEILGNAFVMIIAGHETTANSIHFSLIFLALHPDAQRKLQSEINSIFQHTSPDEWDYESSITTLLGGMAGAVLNEELRLMPPVTNIPKSVRKDQDQTVNHAGRKVKLPRGAQIHLVAIAAHLNPTYWPSRGPSKITAKDDDLDDFVPERWLIQESAVESNSGNVDEQAGSDHEGFGGFTGTDSSAQLFRPTKGAYLPFSDGARSCLGRRLAQVEIMAVLAVIFQTYSIELAVDEWATDSEVARMTDREKTKLYRKAQEKARATIAKATTLITLKLHDATDIVPIRVVPKGEERFLHLID